MSKKFPLKVQQAARKLFAKPNNAKKKRKRGFWR
jgi:hypothetical protein